MQNTCIQEQQIKETTNANIPNIKSNCASPVMTRHNNALPTCLSEVEVKLKLVSKGGPVFSYIEIHVPTKS